MRGPNGQRTFPRLSAPPNVPALTARLRQRLLEIGDQILDVLNAHRESDQRVVDAERSALIGGHRSVRHDPRMIDQALDAAETLGDREYPAALEAAARRIDSAANEEADDAAEPVLHLRARQRVLRMTR